MTRKASSDGAWCRGIVGDVSRTFAIGIERMPEPWNDHVGVPYLLCRIPDTIEDDRNIPFQQKQELLESYHRLLSRSTRGANACEEFVERASAWRGHDACWELVMNTPRVFRVFETFPPEIHESVERHLREMVAGMREFILRYENRIRIATLPEFSRYCYYVAGTVGMMLTGIFSLWHRFDDDTRLLLESRAVDFGESLQAVNILKDVFIDFENEDNIYIPSSVLEKHGTSHARMFEDRQAATKAMDELIEHAVAKLESARQYIESLPVEATAARDFCIVPYLLAVRTVNALNRNRDRLMTPSPVKISRVEVLAILTHVPECIRNNDYLRFISRRALTEPRFKCA